MLSECLIYLTFVFLCLFYVEKEMIKKNLRALSFILLMKELA